MPPFRPTGSYLLVLLIPACAATGPLPDALLLHEELSARTDPAVVRAALAALPLAPLQLPVPRYQDSLAAPDAQTFRALALAHDPEVRLARARVHERLAAHKASGRLAGIELGAMTMDLGDLNVDSEVQLTFDLLRLLGLGRSAAERVLAEQEVRVAVAQLEAAVWQAWFAVESERLAVAAAMARIAALDALALDLDRDMVRIRLLGQQGWLVPSQIEEASATLHQLEHRRGWARAELVAARSVLAVRTGLSPSDPKLPGIQATDLDPPEGTFKRPVTPAPPGQEPTAHKELLAMLLHHPELRAAHLELAVAAAAVDLVRARRFPDLGIGPLLTFMPGERLLGAVAMSTLPLPSSLGAEIDQAVARFELQRTLFVDAVAARRARLAAAVGERAAAEEIYFDHLEPQEAQSITSLRAARAQFWVEPSALERYTMAIQKRLKMVDMVIDARLQKAQTRLAHEQALGPLPPEGAAGPLVEPATGPRQEPGRKP